MRSRYFFCLLVCKVEGSVECGGRVAAVETCDMARVQKREQGSRTPHTALKNQGAVGRVSTGLCGKKSNGRRTKSCHMTGMTGQSSARVTWWKPSVYQATMSVFSMGRLALVQAARVSSPLLSVG